MLREVKWSIPHTGICWVYLTSLLCALEDSTPSINFLKSLKIILFENIFNFIFKSEIKFMKIIFPWNSNSQTDLTFFVSRRCIFNQQTNTIKKHTTGNTLIEQVTQHTCLERSWDDFVDVDFKTSRLAHTHAVEIS